MNQSDEQSFIDRLNQHPKLRKRMEALLNVVENVAGDCTKADAAEQHVIEELRKMGNDALHCWGDKAVIKSAEQLREQQPTAHKKGKKDAQLYLSLYNKPAYLRWRQILPELDSQGDKIIINLEADCNIFGVRNQNA